MRLNKGGESQHLRAIAYQGFVPVDSPPGRLKKRGAWASPRCRAVDSVGASLATHTFHTRTSAGA